MIADKIAAIFRLTQSGHGSDRVSLYIPEAARLVSVSAMSAFFEGSLEISFAESFLFKLAEIRTHILTFPLALWETLSSQQAHNQLKIRRLVNTFKQSKKSTILVAITTTPTTWAVVCISHGGTEIARCSHDPFPPSSVALVTRLCAEMIPGYNQPIRYHCLAELNEPVLAFFLLAVKLSHPSQSAFPIPTPSRAQFFGWKDAVLSFMLGITLDMPFETFSDKIC